jgi:acyl-coenzyme A synthetase/AMP-(fatty) acid ligase
MCHHARRYYEVIGDSRCPIMDTWWQTETGAHMITPLVGATPLKPGSATKPFFGVEPAICDEKGNELHGACEGLLMIKRPWPSMMRGIAGNQERFEQTYFSMFKGMYFTGDGCRRDKDGYYWIIGRVDDVINVRAAACNPCACRHHRRHRRRHRWLHYQTPDARANPDATALPACVMFTGRPCAPPHKH